MGVDRADCPKKGLVTTHWKAAHASLFSPLGMGEYRTNVPPARWQWIAAVASAKAVRVDPRIHGVVGGEPANRGK
jgi:hypothetical protein